MPSSSRRCDRDDEASAWHWLVTALISSFAAWCGCRWQVADNMKQGEWVYLLVQDLQSGKTITIEGADGSPEPQHNAATQSR